MRFEEIENYALPLQSAREAEDAAQGCARHPRHVDLLDRRALQGNAGPWRRPRLVLADHGWAEYRTAPTFQDAVAKTYSFNNNILMRFQETLKDAIDPNGIMPLDEGASGPNDIGEQVMMRMTGLFPLQF